MTTVKFAKDEQLLLTLVTRKKESSLAESIFQLKHHPSLRSHSLRSDSHYRKFIKAFKENNPILWTYLRVGFDEQLLKVSETKPTRKNTSKFFQDKAGEKK